MKKLIPIKLAFLLLLFASTAIADRGYKNNDYRQKALQGERIEKHLATQGGSIEHHFFDKEFRAAHQGKSYKASHLQKRGHQINRKMKHKGVRIHAQHDRRGYHPSHYRHYKAYKDVYYPPRRYRDNFVSVIMRQPGFLFAWGWDH